MRSAFFPPREIGDVHRPPSPVQQPRLPAVVPGHYAMEVGGPVGDALVMATMRRDDPVFAAGRGTDVPRRPPPRRLSNARSRRSCRLDMKRRGPQRHVRKLARANEKRARPTFWTLGER
jgi:hypothetical protein